MNRKRLTAVILSAGLVLSSASFHHTKQDNHILLANHEANVVSSNNDSTQTTTINKTSVQNENSNTEKEQNSTKVEPIHIEHNSKNTSHLVSSTKETIKPEVKKDSILHTKIKTSTQNKKTHSSNVNSNLALEANTNIQIAYIGGSNNTQMDSNNTNTYSFAAINPNSKSSETNVNIAPKTSSKAPLTFASPLQKKLYEYLSVPANQATTMQTAISLHDGNPNDTCVLFQSSALRANGFNIPMNTAYTTVFQGNLLERGWEKHTNFNNLQPGDICFASTYHTFMFMGWYNKEKKIAYVMGNESYMNSKYYRERHIDGQVPTPENGYNNQYQATSYYTYTGTPDKKPVLSGQIIGGTTNVMSQPFDGGSVLGQVYYGDNVAILKQDGYYYQIEKNGLIGWVYAVDLMPTGTLKNYVAPKKDDTHKKDEPITPVIVSPSNKGETIQVTSPVGLWLLQSPSLQSSKIKIMPYNTKIEVLGQNGSWTKVNYNGTIGWCYTQYTKIVAKPDVKPIKPDVKPVKPDIIIGTTTITSNIGLWQLSSPSMQGGHITVIPDNVKVNVYNEKNGWYEVSYNGVKGWSYAEYTSGLNKNSGNTPKPTAQTARVHSNIGLWLLSSPSMQGGHISVMPNNSNLTVLDHSGNWTKVNFNGTIGWCYSEYITQTNNKPTPIKPVKPIINNTSIGSTTITSNNGLWQLSSPSMQGGHITVIPSGVQVQVFAEQNGWYEVSYNGVKGWSYAKYTSGLNKPSDHVSAASAMKQVTSTIGLWLLQSPSLTAGKIEIMPYQANLKVLAQNGAWTKVDYNGTQGWCYNQYTKNI